MRTANVSVGRYPLDALEPSLTGSKLQQQCEYSCQRQAVLPPLLPEAPASLSLVQHVALDMLIVVLPALLLLTVRGATANHSMVYSERTGSKGRKATLCHAAISKQRVFLSSDRSFLNCHYIRPTWKGVEVERISQSVLDHLK